MRPLNLIVAGSRGIKDQALVDRILNRVRSPIRRVISGGARGIDDLGRMWAESKGIPCVCMPAQWDIFGKSAGYRRNVEMAKFAVSFPDCDGALVAIWDGISPGTRHMINIAQEYGLKVWVPDLKLF